MSPFALEINDQGYLVVPRAIAETIFPEDVCVALRRELELWLLPIRSAASGGLLMKQRNAQGDRSVLVTDSLPEEWHSGTYPAFWDGVAGAVRIRIGDG